MLAPPTAVQVETLMQLIEFNAVEPAGAPEIIPLGTAVRCADDMCSGGETRCIATHVIPLRAVAAVGGVWGTQVVPPSVVFRIREPDPLDGNPTAMQCVESGQEMPVNHRLSPDSSPGPRPTTIGGRDDAGR